MVMLEYIEAKIPIYTWHQIVRSWRSTPTNQRNPKHCCPAHRPQSHTQQSTQPAGT